MGAHGAVRCGARVRGRRGVLGLGGDICPGASIYVWARRGYMYWQGCNIAYALDAGGSQRVDAGGQRGRGGRGWGGAGKVEDQGGPTEERVRPCARAGRCGKGMPFLYLQSQTKSRSLAQKPYRPSVGPTQCEGGVTSMSVRLSDVGSGGGSLTCTRRALHRRGPYC